MEEYTPKKRKESREISSSSSTPKRRKIIEIEEIVEKIRRSPHDPQLRRSQGKESADRVNVCPANIQVEKRGNRQFGEKEREERRRMRDNSRVRDRKEYKWTERKETKRIVVVEEDDDDEFDEIDDGGDVMDDVDDEDYCSQEFVDMSGNEKQTDKNENEISIISDSLVVEKKEVEIDRDLKSNLPKIKNNLDKIFLLGNTFMASFLIGWKIFFD